MTDSIEKPMVYGVVNSVGDVASGVVNKIDGVTRAVENKVGETNSKILETAGELTNKAEGAASEIANKLRGAVYLVDDEAEDVAYKVQGTRITNTITRFGNSGLTILIMTSVILLTRKIVNTALPFVTTSIANVVHVMKNAVSTVTIKSVFVPLVANVVDYRQV